MRQLLFSFIFLFTISIVSCSDNGTGPNNEETTTYSVAVNVTPSDAGSISPSSEDTHGEGEEVELQADANEEYIFTHWSGDIDSTSDNPLSLTVDQDYNLTANFELKTYELSINTEGEGSVNEEVLEQKYKDYEHGTVVELTANPDEGYKFVEWKGDFTGSENPAQITVDDPKEVTAVFEKKSYELTVNTEGEGAVSEQVIQQKSTDYEHGTVVELTASPAEGWKFVEWNSAVTGSENPIEVTVDEAKEVTAIFERKSYSLSLSTEGEGEIVKDPDQQEYEYNSTIDLQANPAEGYEFVEWQEDISSTKNPTEITIDSDKEIVAKFEKKTFTLSVEKSGEGSVSLYPDQSEYKFGTEVELSASASGDWIFNSWEGDITGESNPITITINSNQSITALFKNTVFAGGAGTKENPYQISTIEELQAINDYPNAHYIQLNDIDASETANWSDGKGFKPIGGDIVHFKGTYDGQNYEIQNLIINRQEEDWVALFGTLDSDGIILNTIVNSSEVTGKANTGGIIGENNGTIENSTFEGNVIGSDATGGLIGWNRNNGTVITSSTSGSVTSDGQDVGGLIGTMGRYGCSDPCGLEIIESFSNANVDGSSFVGGLIGYNNHGIIKDSYASGNVEATGATAGGLVSINYGTVKSSYASGNINGQTGSTSGGGIGGLIGTNRGEINLSYAIGDIQAQENIGGLVGENNGSIDNSYAKNTISGEDKIGGLVGIHRDDGTISTSYSSSQVTGNQDYGGFIGINGALVESSYWDTEKAGQSNGVGSGSSNGITGLTTSNMTGSSAESNMSTFDWEEIWITTDDYPILYWE